MCRKGAPQRRLLRVAAPGGGYRFGDGGTVARRLGRDFRANCLLAPRCPAKRGQPKDQDGKVITRAAISVKIGFHLHSAAQR